MPSAAMPLSLAGGPNCQTHDCNPNLSCSRHASSSSPPDSTSVSPVIMKKKQEQQQQLLPVEEMEGCEAQERCIITVARAPTTRWSCRNHITTTFATRTRPTLLMAMATALLLALIVATPAVAVQIPFDNCLSDSYQLSNPPSLQWVPMYADAVFDSTSPNNNLEVTFWGNVTGSLPLATLPPADSPAWTDPNVTDGKILETPPNNRSVATTLLRKVNVLTYEPWNDLTNFCTGGLINGTCPLPPTFGNVVIPYGLPSINMSHDFFSSYAFTSFSVTFLIINSDAAATNIGCISATITPDLGGLSAVVKFLPLLVLLFAGFAVPFAGIWSPWGTTDIFHWTSNYGRDADLLRLVTPGFGDCLQYIQFIALTGSLTLDYPGFFEPIVSQVGWASLMFNESFVANAKPWQSVVDGIYVTNINTTYGLQKQAQLIGMSAGEDIWAGMMVWLCIIIASVMVLIQVGFAIQWVYRKIKKTTEEDLRAKNIPFLIGNIVRIVFNFMLIPIVALSSFQLVIAGESPSYTVALAALTLVLLIGFASWLLYLIITTRPKSVLFDDLPTVLRYGPLYNTYGDDVAAFALIPILLNLLRGIAIGAVQPSGVAQVVLLAICEVIQIFMIYAFRPFQSATSMNFYHTLFTAVRLVIVMLMVAFIPSMGVTEGPKGWIGYVILLLHACVLVLGFFLGAIQTIIEVVARLLGAGGDDITGLKRGGLSKIFGMRQLSRRVNHRRQGPSRASQLSTSAMLDAEDGSKSGYVMPGGRVRSGSVASLSGVITHHRHRSSSALDSMYSAMHRNMDSGSSYVPGTPGEASTFSFLASPGATRHAPPGLVLEAADPYYRPPRRRRETLGHSSLADTQRGSLTIEPAAPASGMAGDAAAAAAAAADKAAEISRGATPAPGNFTITFPANRPDYSTREVDFYYGVRGPALNSDGPGRRRLGTGPADPTGPVATAAGWVRGLFGGKSKEKGKGFEVVRSARMPPAMMARNGGFGDDTPPEGIPVAMGVIRSGPIDSDDDEPQVKRPKHREGDLLTDTGDPQSDPEEPDSPVVERLPRGRLSQAPGSQLKAPGTSHAGDEDGDEDDDDDEDNHDDDIPDIPRKSSKRHSAMVERSRTPSFVSAVSDYERPVSPESHDNQSSSGQHNQTSLLPRLPFDRQGSERRPSSNSSLTFSGGVPIDLDDGQDAASANFGFVAHRGINRIDPGHGGADLLGASAEMVADDESSMSSKRRTRSHG